MGGDARRRGADGWRVCVAHAAFDEQDAGTIAVGKRADFMVLDVDPFRASGAELLRGKVVLTVSRGRVTFSRPLH